MELAKMWRLTAITVALGGTSVASADSWGIKFMGGVLTDPVTQTAGIEPISGWNNITNTTDSSGTLTSSDGSLSAPWTLSGPDAANGWNTGFGAGDGGNTSFNDGYLDVGNSGAAIMTINNLPSAFYTVYVLTLGDSMRPQNGGDWLPNYEVNGVTNFIAVQHIKFNNDSPTNWVQAGSTTANNNNYPPGLKYGNYTVFYNVVPDPLNNQSIVVTGGPDNRTWRSAFAGIELVSGATTNPVGITLQPVSQRVLTNTPATFSIGVSGTLINIQWYKVVGGVTNGIANATNLSISIPPVLDSDTGTAYFAAVTNVISATNSALAVVTAGHIVGPIAGFLEADEYSGFASGTLAMDALYPASTYPSANSPYKTEYLSSANDNADLQNNGGERIFGWFTPPLTAHYIFYVASDDLSALWLSTDNTPTNCYEIAQNTSWMYGEDWTLTQTSSSESSSGDGLYQEYRSDQFELQNGNQGTSWAVQATGTWTAWPGLNGDGSISLTAGTPYYIELDHFQGGGGQCAAVTYKLAGQPDPVYQSAPTLAGLVLSTAQALDGAGIVISNQPANETSQQNTPATFSVTASTFVAGSPAAIPPGLEYQWQVMPSGGSTWANISGANSSTYAIAQTAVSNNGSQYRVILTTLAWQTNTAAATLTVAPDVIKPSIAELGATPTVISVTWNKLLDATSAQTIANYQVSGGVTVTSATLYNNVAGAYAAGTVELGISGATAGNSYTLTVNNVKDLSQVQTVVANSTAPFVVYNVYADFNEGAVASFGTVITNTGGLASFGVNAGFGGSGGVTLQIPSGGNGGFTINDTLNGAQVNSFVASFKLFLGPFANNNDNNPGPSGYGNDVAFSFGPNSGVYYGATTVGGSGINAPGAVAVVINTGDGSSGVNVYYGGVSVTNAVIADNTVLVNSQWNDVTVALSASGAVDVVINGSHYVTQLAMPSYAPISAGSFAIAADSGLNWQLSTVDDIAILENAALPPAALKITQSGAIVSMSWAPAGGHLQSAATLGGSWTDVPGSQPVQLPVGGNKAFFRVVVP